MATLHAPPAVSLIESASSLFRDSHASPGRDTTVSRSISSPTKDTAAMALRLHQLQAALGENAPTTPPASKQPSLTVPPSALGGYRLSTLFFACIGSALLAAGLTWQAAGAGRPSEAATAAPHTAPAPLPAIPLTTIALAPAAMAAQQDNNQHLSIGNQLEAWRKAWMSRDIDAYLATYSRQFTPSNGGTRETWASERRLRLSSGKPITLALRQIEIQPIDDRHASAHFLQSYASGHYREIDRMKTLALVREDNAWKIAGEWQDKAPPAAH